MAPKGKIQSIETFGRAFAQLVAELSESGYYTQNTAPVGKRCFLEAARNNEFASFKKGRMVLARKVDVHKWIETSPLTKSKASQPRPSVDEDEEAERQALGLERRGAA